MATTKLKQRRIELGLKQSEVATKAEILLSTYQKLESGVNDIKKAQAYTVLKIADVLGTTVLELIKE